MATLNFTPEDLICEIFSCNKEEISPIQMHIYLRNLERLFAEMDERKVCVLRKRYFEGCTFEKSGKSIIRLDGKYNPCDGVSKERAKQLIWQAIRQLRLKRNRLTSV